jgi:hypothetical protein
MNHPEAQKHKGEFKRIFTAAIADESKVEDEVKEKLKQALPSLQ